MPKRAVARIRPKVKTEPPSSGESIRYQTSSSRKNAKPTIPHAASTNRRGGGARSAGGASSSAAPTAAGSLRRERKHATSATARLSAHAAKSVPRLPRRSKP